MSTYLIQHNGENLDTIRLARDKAGCWAIEALSAYAERNGYGRYDEMDETDRWEYDVTDLTDYAEAIYENGYLKATLIGRPAA